ncbi:ChbG/HpnK family deacetylase [Oryzicola mucosus]|uniref:ChbG/HpnK family deacetylase n=1 Tax=Oryzicola mucosus TaxID=2767425 RepID=A0A8J6PG57_9HYPH|nr:ChbG/HpnK family deacetylase [Oryzicola mucosus]MBD0414649.1 ChbG/HpnK family deacetylase [Oryzicola mucosus]
MTRGIRLIADDYGLSPGVSDAILDLIERGRLSGTGCMTAFPEWPDHAARIRHLRTMIGLHLTLTDQPAATGVSSLAPGGTLPPLSRLALPFKRAGLDEADIHAELDAQLARFVDAIGHEPDFIDGHQHVHFLPVVRTWLSTRTWRQRPVLRGAPRYETALSRTALKIAAIAGLATGFDATMQKAGFQLWKPLAGIYDWQNPSAFAPTLDKALTSLPESGVFMCHPGHVDDVLKARDPMLDVREAEHRYLASDAFGGLLVRSGVHVVNEPT